MLCQQNAILTKDNLSKRNWQDDTYCCFYPTPESMLHLFFDYPIARYIWSLVAHVVGVVCRPNSFEQFWFWANAFLPNHKHIHSVGLAAICCAIWRARKLSCFEQKSIKSPTEIVCMSSSFICYWSGLQKTEDRAEIEAGAEVLKESALSFHPREASSRNAGLLPLH